MIIQNRAGNLRPPAGLCPYCSHFTWESSSDGHWSCTAYPEGIPEEIAASKIDHRLPYDEDSGIQFQLKEGETLPLDIESDLLAYTTQALWSFQRLWMYHRQARQAYRAGTLSEDQLLDELSNWLLEDWAGNYWTIGKTENHWYRLIDYQWLETPPPFPIETITSPEDEVDNDERLIYSAHYEIPTDVESEHLQNIFKAVAFERSELVRNIRAFLKQQLFENEVSTGVES